jgi:hypothetical protein
MTDALVYFGVVALKKLDLGMHLLTAAEIDSAVQLFLKVADEDFEAYKKEALSAGTGEVSRPFGGPTFRTLTYQTGFSEQEAATYDEWLARVREGADSFSLYIESHDTVGPDQNNFQLTRKWGFGNFVVRYPGQGSTERIAAPLVEAHLAWLSREQVWKDAVHEEITQPVLPEPSQEAPARGLGKRLVRGWKSFWNHKLVIGIAPAVVTYFLGLWTPR